MPQVKDTALVEFKHLQEKVRRYQHVFDAQAEEAKRNREQANCDHRKPNSKPCLVGQRDHQGVLQLTCSHCGKCWTETTCPPALLGALDPTRFGGPIGSREMTFDEMAVAKVWTELYGMDLNSTYPNVIGVVD